MQLTRLPALSEAAASELRRGGPASLWADIVSDVRQGWAHVFTTTNGSYLILRVDGDDLVILAASGHNGNAMMQACVELARTLKLKNVRFHTAKKGLPRLLSRFNPVEVERVFEVRVNEN